jgi:multidrug transporter EmrE-like cation transporter
MRSKPKLTPDKGIRQKWPTAGGNMDTILIILLGVTFAAVGQVSWKLGMNLMGPVISFDLSNLRSILLEPYIILGLIMYALSTVFWLVALSRMELSFVYPFISLTYILVLALSYLVLKESIGLNKMAGSALIILGLIIISRFN